MTRARLLDVERTSVRRVGSTVALVHVPRDRCPVCRSVVESMTVVTEALFSHGGYGAARREVRLWCSALCGWSILGEVAEQRPAR